jgi:hypothetical protein
MVLAKRGEVPAKWRAFPAKLQAFLGKVWKVLATRNTIPGFENIVSMAKKHRFKAQEIVSRRAARLSR